MKKYGFTLSEALIALAIVGVLSAIMLPLANKYKPDPHKALFLKVYDNLVTITSEMASNTRLFPLIDDNCNYENAPLFNTVPVTIEELNNRTYPAEGDNRNPAKICEILADYLNAYDDNKCTEMEVVGNDNDKFNEKISFTTPQNIQFSVNVKMKSENPETPALDEFNTEITFDVNGEETPNCIYSETCPDPDRFRVLLGPTGHIFASDSMARQHLLTRSNLRKTIYPELPKELNRIPEAYRTTPEKLDEEE